MEEEEFIEVAKYWLKQPGNFWSEEDYYYIAEEEQVSEEEVKERIHREINSVESFDDLRDYVLEKTGGSEEDFGDVMIEIVKEI